MASSFKKKSTTKPTYPRGTKPSFHNSSLLVSTGVPSLDSLLGGGIAVGTAIFIEEDAYSTYSTFLVKYFLSEGIMSGHELFVSNGKEDPRKIVNGLPSVADEAVKVAKESSSSESMKIAWRYQNQPEVESSFSKQFGHFYDLSKHMDKGRLEEAKTTYFPSQWKGNSLSYDELIRKIQDHVDGSHFGVSEALTGQRNVLRVAVQSLGTPIWNNGVIPSNNSLPIFLHKLRALLRQSYAVALLTAPTELLEELGNARDVERLCDSVVRLEAFEGSDKESNPLYKDYHGLFHFVKLPRINAMLPCQPETLDLAFKLKRKRFSIEKLHLPPDLSETVSREPQSSKKKVDLTNVDF
jgi:elongator complex protein 4